MSSKMKKFDISILDTKSDRFKYIKPVRSMDTFVGMTRDFHEDGLFSTSIFGKVGTVDRNLRMSYIDVKIEIFSAKIFMLICGYRQMYKNIIMGTTYATWDSKLKDFVKSTNVDGHTGFNFFLQHWKEIRFVKNDSYSQNEAVEDINKYKDIALTNRVMVIPAGLRDVEVDNNDEITKHEINDFYIKLLSIANSLPDSGDLNTDLTNRSRLSLQLTYCELYSYLSKLTGQLKKSFMRRKWGTRRIKYGSRNVITPLPSLPVIIGDPSVINFNQTAIGLFQAISIFSPIIINSILTDFAPMYISPTDGTMNLINPKTLLREVVTVKTKVIDKWTTPTGIGKLIDGFKDIEIRNKPIVINGHYLGLIYRTDKAFRVIDDISEVVEMGLDVKDVYPITYSEMFYIYGYSKASEYPATNTRYPINGYGSIYPSYVKIITNQNELTLTELDAEFKPAGDITYHYPNPNDNNWFDGMAVHQSRLTGMGGDYDGDMCNLNPSFSDEAKRSVKRFINDKSAYLNSSGRLSTSPFTDTLARVIYSLSGDMQ